MQTHSAEPLKSAMIEKLRKIVDNMMDTKSATVTGAYIRGRNGGIEIVVCSIDISRATPEEITHTTFYPTHEKGEPCQDSTQYSRKQSESRIHEHGTNGTHRR